MGQTSLTAEERESIALAASIAAGCRPCTEYHVAQARAAGVDDDGLRGAIATGLGARDETRVEMAELAERLLGGSGQAAPSHPAGTLLGELTRLAASFAMNSAQGVQTCLVNARAAGANPRQVAAAVSIARAVRTTAAEKLEGAVAELPADPSAAAVCRPDADQTCEEEGRSQAQQNACECSEEA